MTSNGHYVLCFKIHVFEAHQEILNKDRPKLSAAEIKPSDPTFWQYKIYADIRGCPVTSAASHDVFQWFRSLYFGNI